MRAAVPVFVAQRIVRACAAVGRSQHRCRQCLLTCWVSSISDQFQSLVCVCSLLPVSAPCCLSACLVRRRMAGGRSGRARCLRSGTSWRTFTNGHAGTYVGSALVFGCLQVPACHAGASAGGLLPLLALHGDQTALELEDIRIHWLCPSCWIQVLVGANCGARNLSCKWH